MSKINVMMISDDMVRQYDHIMYDQNFLELILRQEPGRCYISDKSLMCHFGIDFIILKKTLWHKFGYRLRTGRIRVWKVLQNIDELQKEQQNANRTTRMS